MDHASTNETTGQQTQQPAERTEETPQRRDTSTHSPSLARFYMTSDLRTATGLTRTHLDFYLREGVIVPTARTESGYLLFDDEELSVLRQVIAWRQSGVGVRDILARLGRDQSSTEASS